jgi:hypothetical protein
MPAAKNQLPTGHQETQYGLIIHSIFQEICLTTAYEKDLPDMIKLKIN